MPSHINELGVSPGWTLDVINTIRFFNYLCLKLVIVIKSTLFPTINILITSWSDCNISTLNIRACFTFMEEKLL